VSNYSNIVHNTLHAMKSTSISRFTHASNKAQTLLLLQAKDWMHSSGPSLFEFYAL